MDAVLAKKLNIKPGEMISVINPPGEFKALLPSASHGAQADLTLLFVKNQAELKEHAHAAINSIKSGARLWVAYPKKSSKIKSDLSRDTGWETFTDSGFTGVMLISIDDCWSAFRLRPSSEIKTMTRSTPVPRDQRPVLVVPNDLAASLAANPGMREFFDSLPYTHRKEYITWIEEAKKPETRARRIEKALEFMREKSSRK